MISFDIFSYTINIASPLLNLVLLIFLITLTIAVYFYMVYGRKKRVSHFGNISTLEKVHGFKRFYVSPTILIFKILIIVLLFLAATDSVNITQLNPSTNVDYVLVLDASPSMSLNDYPPSRLSAAKTIANDWISIAPNNTAIGLVIYADEVITSNALTTNREFLKEQVDGAFINYSRSGTSLDSALNEAIDILQESNQNKTVLLMTDGTDVIDNQTIFRAIDERVEIFSFGIGSTLTQGLFDDVPEEFADFYETMDFNFTTLESLSQRTSGEAYEVSNVEELDIAFRQATLERISIQLNSQYYVILLIALLSITEFLLYSRWGGL